MVIDAEGLVVSPGFIDMHTHSDLRVFKHPEEDAKLMQGITTALVGQDGLSVAPIDDANKTPMMQRVSGLLGTYLEDWHWSSMADYLSAVDAVNPATNSMMLVPHGAIRATVLGWENRCASPDELEDEEPSSPGTGRRRRWVLHRPYLSTWYVRRSKNWWSFVW